MPLITLFHRHALGGRVLLARYLRVRSHKAQYHGKRSERSSCSCSPTKLVRQHRSSDNGVAILGCSTCQVRQFSGKLLSIISFIIDHRFMLRHFLIRQIAVNYFNFRSQQSRFSIFWVKKCVERLVFSAIPPLREKVCIASLIFGRGEVAQFLQPFVAQSRYF